MNHFDTEKHRDGEGAHHEEDGDDGQDDGSAAATDISVTSGVIRVSFRYNIVTIHDGNNLNTNAISKTRITPTHLISRPSIIFSHVRHFPH